MPSEPTNTIHLGLIMLVFAGLAFDMRAWFMGGALLILGLLFIWANVASNN